MSTSGSQSSTIIFPHKPYTIPFLPRTQSMLHVTYTSHLQAQNTRANDSVLNLHLLFTIVVLKMQNLFTLISWTRFRQKYIKTTNKTEENQSAVSIEHHWKKYNQELSEGRGSRERTRRQPTGNFFIKKSDSIYMNTTYYAQNTVFSTIMGCENRWLLL